MSDDGNFVSLLDVTDFRTCQEKLRMAPSRLFPYCGKVKILLGSSNHKLNKVYLQKSSLKQRREYNQPHKVITKRSTPTACTKPLSIIETRISDNNYCSLSVTVTLRYIYTIAMYSM